MLKVDALFGCVDKYVVDVARLTNYYACTSVMFLFRSYHCHYAAIMYLGGRIIGQPTFQPFATASHTI